MHKSRLVRLFPAGIRKIQALRMALPADVLVPVLRAVLLPPEPFQRQCRHDGRAWLDQGRHRHPYRHAVLDLRHRSGGERTTVGNSRHGALRSLCRTALGGGQYPFQLPDVHFRYGCALGHQRLLPVHGVDARHRHAHQVVARKLTRLRHRLCQRLLRLRTGGGHIVRGTGLCHTAGNGLARGLHRTCGHTARHARHLHDLC